jgi:TRAP-type C4-dicarboxylate transport system substrate-binding protein
MKRMLLKTLLAAAVVAIVMPVAAQTKLKWAHVYETSEPYHTQSVWAAEEIKKRTNGKFEIQVFPASSLGKETDINQGLQLGTVDMIISGPSFAARSYPRIGIAYYPFIFRDGEHLLAYSKSAVFKEMIDGYREKTGIQILAYTYYGARHTSAQKAFTDCAGMKGIKIRVPDVPAYRATPEACGANPTPIGRCAREPADHDRGEEVLRSAEAHHADRSHRRRPDDAGRAACLDQADRWGEEDLLRSGA